MDSVLAPVRWIWCTLFFLAAGVLFALCVAATPASAASADAAGKARCRVDQPTSRRTAKRCKLRIRRAHSGRSKRARRIRLTNSPNQFDPREHKPVGEDRPTFPLGGFRPWSDRGAPTSVGNLSGQGGATQKKGVFAAALTSPITAAITHYGVALPYDSYWENSGATAGNVVFTTGNWGAAYSVDGGVKFNTVSPYAMFPDSKGKPIVGPGGFCCDQVVQYVPRINRFVWVLQSVPVNAVDGENVYRVATATPEEIKASNGTRWTTFDITPTGTGVPGNWFDYPSISAGDPRKKGAAPYVYLTFNKLDQVRGSDGTVRSRNRGSVVARISYTQLKKKAGEARTWQSVYTPYLFGHAVQDQGTSGYFGFMASRSQLAVYVWPRVSSTAVEKKVNIVTVPSEGGSVKTADGTPWLSNPSSQKIYGGTLARNTLWLAWNAGRGYPSGVGEADVFPFPHIEVARLNRKTLALSGGKQRAIWSNDYAMAQPSLASTARGEVGMTYAWGGAPHDLVRTRPENWVNTGVAMLTGTTRFITTGYGSAGAGGEHYMTTRRAYPRQSCLASFAFTAGESSSPGKFKDDPTFAVFGRSTDRCAFHKPPPEPPTAVTGDSKDVAYDSATVEGTVNPNGSDTTVWFEYGTTTDYTNSTSIRFAGSGTEPVSISATLLGLSPSTTYHYRIVGSNAADRAGGADRTFTTPPAPAPPPPPPGPLPDLVISSLTKDSFTVTNNGSGPAGAFKVRVSQETGGSQVFDFSGLAPGASASQDFFCRAGNVSVLADVENRVAETDEANNGAQRQVPGCIS